MAKYKCNRDDLTRAIQLLRNTAPEEFAAFVKQFSMYAEDTVVAVTEADHVEILKMQGRAQQCLALKAFFEEYE